jgi:hypothetical protein
VLSGTAFFFATNLAATKVLQHAGPVVADQFGFAVAASGDRVIVGAFADDLSAANTGSAFIYEKDAGGAGNWGQVKQLNASDRAVNDQFAVAVDLDGDTAVLGAFADGSTDTGSAYVYERDHGGAGNWGEIRKLNVTGLSASAFFGRSVAIDGDTIVVAAYTNLAGGFAVAGSIWIFSRNLDGPNAWGVLKRIDSPAPATNGQFGWDVSVDGDTIVVAELGRARVHFFERNSPTADSWGNTATVTVTESGLFAWSAEISGDTAVVGAITATNPSGVAAGAAYIFERNQDGPNTWGIVKKISASDGVVNDQFGISADIAGDTIVVGAFAQDATGIDSGAAYHFSRDEGGAGSWGEVNKLVGSAGTTQHQMGFSAATTATRAVIGAPYNPSCNWEPCKANRTAGFAYVFDFAGAVTPTSTAPAAPTLVSPSGTITDTGPTYTWNEVTGATDYRVWIDGPSGNVHGAWYEASSVCSGGTCSVASPPVATLIAGDYTLEVRAKNGFGLSVWSTALAFTVSVPPGQPTAVFPSGAITDTTPTYTWNEVPGATSYRLWVDGPSGNVHGAWYTAASVCSGGTCSVASPPVATLAAGSHTIEIRASNTAGLSSWSAALSFTVFTALT